MSYRAIALIALFAAPAAYAQAVQEVAPGKVPFVDAGKKIFDDGQDRSFEGTIAGKTAYRYEYQGESRVQYVVELSAVHTWTDAQDECAKFSALVGGGLVFGLPTPDLYFDVLEAFPKDHFKIDPPKGSDVEAISPLWLTSEGDELDKLKAQNDTAVTGYYDDKGDKHLLSIGVPMIERDVPDTHKDGLPVVCMITEMPQTR